MNMKTLRLLLGMAFCLTLSLPLAALADEEASEEAPEDGEDKDCDKKKANKAPSDAEDKDCDKSKKADKALADGEGKDCDKK